MGVTKRAYRVKKKPYAVERNKTCAKGVVSVANVWECCQREQTRQTKLTVAVRAEYCANEIFSVGRFNSKKDAPEIIHFDLAKQGNRFHRRQPKNQSSRTGERERRR